MSDIDLDKLREELADLAEPEKKGGPSAREERIIAGFQEIQRFVEKYGRAPQHGEDRDIFERLYAVRLDPTEDLIVIFVGQLHPTGGLNLDQKAIHLAYQAVKD